MAGSSFYVTGIVQLSVPPGRLIFVGPVDLRANMRKSDGTEASDAEFEATLAYEAPKSTANAGGRHQAEWVVDSTGEPLELVECVRGLRPCAGVGRAAVPGLLGQRQLRLRHLKLWRGVGLGNFALRGFLG